MKKSLLLLLFVSFLGAASVFAQTKETRNVSGFTKISFRTPGKLYLRQGPTTKVEIEGKSELLAEIETEVDGGKLVIGKKGKWTNWKWDNDDRINVYITMPTVEALNVGGSGDIIAETKIKSTELDLNVSGSGNLRIETEVTGALQASVSGSGDIVMRGSCKSFDSNVSGSGKIELALNVESTADFGVSGSGKIEASGKANAVKASISGSGKVMAANLETNKCNVRISGSGDVEINVKDELEANISGSGSVAYKGEPKKLSSHSAGSGKVRKM